MCQKERHINNLDIIWTYLMIIILFQKVKTFYSHPIIRWIMQIIQTKRAFPGSFCFTGKAGCDIVG